MRYFTTMIIVILLCTACYGSRKISGDASTDTRGDTSADAPADTAVDTTADGTPSCTRDADCVIALSQDRCCLPDPLAIPRSVLEADPCLHELGVPWEDAPGCGGVSCESCIPISMRAYEARCEDGRCVPVTDFCPPMVSPEPVASLATWSEPEGGWARYRGQVVEVRGQPMKGPDSCQCCYECDCDCFDTRVQWTLDCMITVRGSACGVPWECTGTECDHTCTPDLETWGWIFLQGYVVDSEAGGFELWAMNGPDDCPPPGPNPVDATCTPYSGLEGQCQEDLICFYWGDVMDRCVATCRPPGDECTVDEDCPPEDVCHEGYCMWCCPG